LGWERVEEAHLRRFLAALANGHALQPLTVLDFPAVDMYGSHWSVSGQDIPDATTADEAVYLPGRNLLLLAKTSVWCALHGISTLALGTLRGNPFADSSREFLSGFAALARMALDSELEVLTPFARLTKGEVLELGRELPLEHTFSCIAPLGGRHCGRCNKCAERRKGFLAAGLDDRTEYAGE
jgi:7-cyano-7-deazaguanine synthase